MKRPEKYYNVSNSQLSIARHYGGINIEGTYYAYDPQTDTLTRADALKKKHALSGKQPPEPDPQDLFASANRGQP